MMTRTEKLSTERFARAVIEPDRYPDGTVFIGSDQRDVGEILTKAIGELQPIAISYPDGREVIVEAVSVTQPEERLKQPG